MSSQFAVLSKPNLVIYGKGSTAKLAARTALAAGVAMVLSGPGLTFVDDTDAEVTLQESGHVYLIAIGYQHGQGGMSARRKELCDQLTSLGHQLCRPLLVGVTYFDSIIIGDGSLLLPGTVLHHGVLVGVNCFLSSNVVLGHDVKVGAHCWLNAGVCVDGGAVIGERCVIGANAVIGAGVTLAERTLVGPGAVVLRSTAPGAVVLAPEAVTQRFSSDVYGGLSQ